uniref:Transmembrane protein n=1 Tax=Syphacia muris TaxID=451379 RepID=A0A0N5A814_9BILA
MFAGRSLEECTANGEQRQLIEEVVEENAHEYIKHENFYGGKDEETGEPEIHEEFKRQHFTGQFVRGIIDAFAFIICILLVVTQLGLIDYYYIKYLKDSMWWSWLAADTFVIFTLIWLTVLSMRNNQKRMHDEKLLDAKMKYAWLGWFTYSAVLVAKIVVFYRLYYDTLLEKNFVDQFFDEHLLRLGLSISVLIFIFYLEASHYIPLVSNRQAYIIYLATAITIDLLDTVTFLDLLGEAKINAWELPIWMPITILALGCFNFIMPTFALFRLKFRKLPRKFIFSEKIWSLLYVLIVNGPYLGIRIYLCILLKLPSLNKNYKISIFLIKNIAFIYLAIKDLWLRIQYWRHKKQYKKLTVREESQKWNHRKKLEVKRLLRKNYIYALHSYII